ncbi:MAG: NADH-quinone oxidoreductase subunit G, partial [Proteobacteria bacterium]|nr:NADH-quinone oxidoreductase subunit G [Pseudomonadota bacterium]
RRPACAAPETQGMIVRTKSDKALKGQQSVMECVLNNHPVDCPICDQGGECELQDLAVGFGRDLSRYHERKRSVQDENLGPLIATDMTRCIQCTRCVRFTQEIAGYQELGMIGRGENVKVRTYIEQTVHHEMSGNVIDLCPVGALVSKPYRFSARAWEMMSHPLVSPHDGVGTNLFGHVLRGKIMRVIPRENETINETWIPDRDRFSYEGVYSPDRIQKPMVRKGSEWVETDWETALTKVVEGLKSRASDLGVLASSTSTLEELYLLGRLARGLGSNNIDHRLRQRDFSDQAADPVYPNLGMSIANVDSLNGLLLVGANLRREVPILAHRVRKAALKGAKVISMMPVATEYLFPVAVSIQSGPAQQVGDLAAILSVAAESAGKTVPEHLSSAVQQAKVGDQHRAAAAALVAGEKRAVWLGALAVRHPAYADLRALAAAIAEVTGASFGVLAEGGNAAGAFLAGAVPHREAGGKAAANTGLNALEMVQKTLKAYVLFGGVEPWADSVGADAARNIGGAEFVVAVTPFANDQLRAIAHVLLPMGTYVETSGTYVNLEGNWQSHAGAAQPFAESRPGWKILRVLGTLANISGFEYQSSEDVREELRKLCTESGATAAASTGAINYKGTHRATKVTAGADVLDVSMYHIDALVRRAPSLQKTREGRTLAVTY